jgi:hypothetical protein
MYPNLARLPPQRGEGQRVITKSGNRCAAAVSCAFSKVHEGLRAGAKTVLFIRDEYSILIVAPAF